MPVDCRDSRVTTVATVATGGSIALRIFFQNPNWPKSVSTVAKFAIVATLSRHSVDNSSTNDPLCQQCNLESETIEHYLIRCPSHTIPRIRYLQSLIDSYDYNYVSSLSDFDLVDKFLHGDPTLSNTDNLNLFSMALTYIIDTDRFSFGGQQR